MRKIKRLPLPAGTRTALAAKQAVVDARSATLFSANDEWKNYRKHSSILTVHSTLKKMAGKRERCMYCEDSHGGDIEHFWPKTAYPHKMFTWENHLLCCTGCGRIKGIQFPLDGSNQPLLVNPTAEDPWDSLEFDPDTGNIVARFDANAKMFSAKGTSTVNVLKLDRREALAEGYRRSLRRIKAVLEPYLAPSSQAPDARTIIRALKIADDHGLLEWCFKFSGKKEPPFSEFIARYPLIARKIIASC